MARKKEDEQLRAELEKLKEKHDRDKDHALAGMRKTVASREAALHAEYGAKVGALKEAVAGVEAKFQEAARQLQAAADRLRDGAARSGDEVDALKVKHADEFDRLRREHKETVGALERDRDLDRERARRAAEDILAAAKAKHDADVQKLQSVNDDLRAATADAVAKAKDEARAQAEAHAEVRLGQLRAELQGAREEALGRMATAHANELREKQRAVWLLTTGLGVPTKRQNSLARSNRSRFG